MPTTAPAALAAWQSTQDKALRRAALRPEPCQTQGDADAYQDIYAAIARVRLMLHGARICGRELEAAALSSGLPMPGIGEDISALVDNVEHDAELAAWQKALAECIQEWEER